MNTEKDFKLILAIITVAIVWGTTYLGIRVAVETIPLGLLPESDKALLHFYCWVFWSIKNN
ncbi:MAG: hypothetical protein U0T85_04690 [Cloacibacterium normanense]